jgi:hypothetical protein
MKVGQGKDFQSLFAAPVGNVVRPDRRKDTRTGKRERNRLAESSKDELMPKMLVLLAA